MMTDSVGLIQQLAAQFPCLAKAPGIWPWEPVLLDRWAAGGLPSHGEILAARFILAVWNPEEAWASGRFDMMEALRVWDGPHRKAFEVYVRDPWWP